MTASVTGSFRYFSASVLQLFQDQRGKFLRGIDLPVEFAMKLLLRFPHLALHEIDDLFRLGHRVVFRQCADDGLAAFEQNDRGSDPFAFRIGDDLRFPVGVDVSNGGEGCAEIDSDCFSLSHRRVLENLIANDVRFPTAF